jgi:hypothetical protein
MSTLGEENIKITTSGVMAAERQMNRLGESFSKIAGAARLIAGTGALAIGGILRESMSGTAEGDRFSKALENLTRSMGEGFADRVREATVQMNQWAKSYRQLQPETQRTVADIGLMIVGAGGLAIGLGAVARGLAGIGGLLSTLGIARLAAAFGPVGGIIAGIAAVTAAGVYMYDTFTAKATELSKTQFEISRGWVLTVGTIMNKLGILSDKDMGFINARIGREQEARRLGAAERADAAAKAAAGAAGAAGGAGLRGFTPFIHPEFQSPQAGWERLMKGLAANDPLADIGKAQLAKLGEMDDKLAAGLGAVEKLNDMIPAVR